MEEDRKKIFKTHIFYKDGTADIIFHEVKLNIHNGILLQFILKEGGMDLVQVNIDQIRKAVTEPEER